jgi:hypothetical protein
MAVKILNTKLVASLAQLARSLHSSALVGAPCEMAKAPARALLLLLLCLLRAPAPATARTTAFPPGWNGKVRTRVRTVARASHARILGFVVSEIEVPNRSANLVWRCGRAVVPSDPAAAPQARTPPMGWRSWNAFAARPRPPAALMRA